MELIFVLVLGTVLSIIGGFAFSTVWGLFIVPTFHQAPIGLIQSIGIMLLVQLPFVSMAAMMNASDNRIDSIKAMFLTAFMYIFIIVCAYGWHAFL
jgi:hypothetical protein